MLDGEGKSIAPEFDVQGAEEFFTQVYSADQQHFSLPDWLPLPASPVHFDTEAILVEEIVHLVKNTKSASPPDGISSLILALFDQSLQAHWMVLATKF